MASNPPAVAQTPGVSVKQPRSLIGVGGYLSQVKVFGDNKEEDLFCVCWIIMLPDDFVLSASTFDCQLRVKKKKKKDSKVFEGKKVTFFSSVNFSERSFPTSPSREHLMESCVTF